MQLSNQILPSMPQGNFCPCVFLRSTFHLSDYPIRIEGDERSYQPSLTLDLSLTCQALSRICRSE